MAWSLHQQRQRFSDTQPVHVLHLLETGGPGGAERVLLNIARSLGAPYRSTIGLLRPGWLQTQVSAAGLPHVMINTGRLGDVHALLHLRRIVRESSIHLIHAHEFYMSSLGAALSRLTGIPLVVTMHGKNYYPAKRRRCFILRLVAARASHMVTVSQELQQFFCHTTGIAPQAVQTVYNGIDVQAFAKLKREPSQRAALGIAPQATLIGAIGNLYPVKGHIYLLQALPEILRHHPDVHLVILGRGHMQEPLEAEAKALGIARHVHLLGYCEDVTPWLAAMDIFTLPSLSEGLPLSLLEAMAAGLPVVVTHVGGMPEVVCDGQTGFLTPPGNPQALASKLLPLLAQPDVAHDMGVAGRNRVCDFFSLSAMVAQYRTIYQEALGYTPQPHENCAIL